MSVVLEVARSKFRQRQYSFNIVYSCCFITVTKAFFNILINHYSVCEYPFILKHLVGAYCAPAIVGRSDRRNDSYLRVSD